MNWTILKKNLQKSFKFSCQKSADPEPVPLLRIRDTAVFLLINTAGRQLPPLSSVLYGIISGRRSELAAQLLLREKSGGLRVDTIAISLTCLVAQ
jgi:hypothetical protein